MSADYRAPYTWDDDAPFGRDEEGMPEEFGEDSYSVWLHIRNNFAKWDAWMAQREYPRASYQMRVDYWETQPGGAQTKVTVLLTFPRLADCRDALYRYQDDPTVTRIVIEKKSGEWV